MFAVPTKTRSRTGLTDSPSLFLAWAAVRDRQVIHTCVPARRRHGLRSFPALCKYYSCATFPFCSDSTLSSPLRLRSLALSLHCIYTLRHRILDMWSTAATPSAPWFLQATLPCHGVPTPVQTCSRKFYSGPLCDRATPPPSSVLARFRSHVAQISLFVPIHSFQSPTPLLVHPRNSTPAARFLLLSFSLQCSSHVHVHQTPPPWPQLRHAHPHHTHSN